MYNVERILCPTDFSAGSFQALSVARDIGIRFAAELCLIHVLPILPVLPTEPNFAFEVHEYERLLHDDAQKHLDEMAHELKQKSLQSRVLVGHGDAAGEIVRVAEEQKIDLIVIATVGKTGWRRLAFGSVTEKVVRLAPCPVLTLRGIEKRIASEQRLS
jgi:nucleotide-binding universal stress UspA family protein